MPAPTMDEIAERADASFPSRVLAFGESALVLFAAGFYGKQDAYWVADAGMQATCVDVDADRLDAMAAVYPTDWDFIEADVYSWIEHAVGQWDVVSVDCPTGHFERCAERLPQFCRLARRAVVLGAGAEHAALFPPEAWRVSDVVHRSDYAPGGVFWAVVEAE